MRRLSAMLIVWLSVLAMMGTVSGQTSAAGRVRVIDTLPLSGQELGLNGEISFYFDRPVNCASARETLMIAPEIPGTITCGDGNTSLHFVPETAYERAAEYRFVLDNGLRALDDTTLGENFALQLNTVGFLNVAETLPSPDGTGIVTNTDITVIFNRPVVALMTSEDMGDLPQPLTFEPAIIGNGEWVNTSMYVFHPEDGLRPGTSYMVSVDSGLTGVDASVMRQAHKWRFTTADAQILRVEPRDTAVEVLRDPKISIALNYPLNQDAVEDAFYLRQLGEDSGTIAGTFKWSEDEMIVVFEPDDLLDYNTTYAAGVDVERLRAGAGGLSLAGQTQWTFTTVPLPGIIGTNPEDGAADIHGGRGFTIYFASPMDRNTFRGKFIIEPEPERIQPYYQYDAYSWHFPLKASTTYKITLLAGTKDIYGTPITEPATFEFTTIPIGSQVGLYTPGWIGLYNAYNDTTGLFIRHVNVDRVISRVYHVSTDQFVNWYFDDYVSYQPPSYLPSVKDMLFTRTANVYNPLNEYTQNYLDLGGEDALSPGLYLLRVNGLKDEIDNTGYRDHFMMVMTANLTTKFSLDKGWVWATDMNTGAPIPNVPITVYTPEMERVTATTDDTGLAEFDLPPIPPDEEHLSSYIYLATLNTEQHKGMALSNQADGIDPGMFDVQAKFYRDDYRIYTYTDRPVYRPDQTVYFRAVIRNKDDMTYTLPAMNSVPVQIFNSSGETVYSRELPLTAFGTISGEFTLAKEAPLGYYRIQIEIPKSLSTTKGFQSSLSFSVAEYRLPEFEVDVLPETDNVAQGDTLRVAINGEYYFGGAVSNATVDYTIISQPMLFQYQGDGYYQFYDIDEVYPRRYPRDVANSSATTDENGQFLLELPADLGDTAYSQMFNIEATLYDEAGQTVSNRSQVMVHTGHVYVGGKPQKYVLNADEEAAVDIITVDWDSNPVPEQTVSVQVVEKRWYNVQEMDALGRTVWVWESEFIPVKKGEVITDSEGLATFNFLPPRAGTYQVKLTTHDDSGNFVRSSVSLWASGRQYVSWRQQNSNRIELIADRDSYQVGDTAEIMIASPFQGDTHALITVERQGMMYSEVITMTTNSHVFKLPITPDFAPNVFVSVMLVKGVDEHNLVSAFRIGLIQLEVDTEQKQMNIEITSDVESAAPGETVHYTVHTTNYRGEPVAAEIGVALTDRAALALADSRSSMLLAYFYNLQGLGIRTATPLTLNADLIAQNILDMIKGGGGGGMGMMTLREDFVDTPYWNAVLVTDENGEATFEITLPDNLTTWRLDARAITNGEDGVMLVGQNTHDLLSTRPLIVRPVTPRFFVVDDAVTLAAVVNNNTDSALAVNVSLRAAGVTITGDLLQTVTIPSGGRARVEWSAVVNEVENVELIFSAQSGEFADSSRPILGLGDDRLLPVYRYEVPETVGTAGMLTEGETRVEAVSLPRNLDVTQGELTVVLEPSLAATTVDGLKYLETYPHYCIEQTVSSFLPNIITYRALTRLGVEDDVLQAQLDRNLSVAIQRLYALQHADGGWGWFSKDPSNPLTTAYALIGLVEAQTVGFPVDGSTIERAKSFLQTTFIVPDFSQPNWMLNRQAFVLYALARAGSPDVARTVNLYEVRVRLNLDAKAFLAMTLAYIQPDDPRAETLLADIMTSAVMSATGTFWEEGYKDYWNWSTNLRTTAIVLQTLVTLRPDSELIPNAVRWLTTQRENRAWSTTQETAWSVMALTDWMVVTGELNPDYTYSAGLNDEMLAQGAATSQNVRETQMLTVQVSELLDDEINRLEIARDSGAGVLYYTAHLRTFLPVPEVEALNRGMMVERFYTVPGDETLTPIHEANVGDLIQVHVRVIVPNSLYYVYIDDPIPAGTEVINKQLNTSQQFDIRPNSVNGYTSSRGWGWWRFNNVEFRDEKVLLYSSYLGAGTYEYVYTIRAVVPGVYNVIPTSGQQFYFPEVYGRGDGSTFTILDAGE